MADYRYFGAYASFVAADKASGELLQGADFIVGDEFSIEFRSSDKPAETDGQPEESTGQSGEVAWVKNRFGAYAGYLDADMSRRLRIVAARGWAMRAFLSFVAFTDSPEPGFYWGQVALVCYDPLLEDAFGPWCKALAEKIAEGARVEVALTTAEVDRVLETQGTWLPSGWADIPKPEKGKTAILKQARSFSEKMVDLGREQRPGCMVVGWIFNIALIAGVVALVLHLCGVF